MFLACYTKRQTKRQELALETILERQLEGAVTLELELAAPAAEASVEEFFVPQQRTMTAHAADSIKARFPQHTWINADLARHTLLDPLVFPQTAVATPHVAHRSLDLVLDTHSFL